MKKLMVAVAVTALAIGANAASVKWSTEYEICNGTMSYDDFTSASLVYLIDSATLSQSDIYNAVSGGKSLADAIGDNKVNSAALSGGKISATTFDAFNAGDTKTLYMVLFDDKVGGGSLYFSEEIKKNIIGTGAAAYAFQNDSSYNAVAANMSGFNTSEGGWVAVPEPTSGLLLLLGMAGLALKRKRA